MLQDTSSKNPTLQRNIFQQLKKIFNLKIRRENISKDFFLNIFFHLIDANIFQNNISILCFTNYTD